MTKVLHVLGCGALLAFCWCLAELAWTIRQLRPHLEVTLENLDRTVIIAGAAATHLEKASGTWEKSSQAQTLITTRAMSNVNAAARQATISIATVTKSISGLLSQGTDAITQQNASLLETQKALRDNLAESQKVLTDADTQINSPDVKIALDNLATSSENLATATHEGAASMTDIHAALDYEIKQLEAPVTKLKTAGLIALTVIRKLYF